MLIVRREEAQNVIDDNTTFIWGKIFAQRRNVFSLSKLVFFPPQELQILTEKNMSELRKLNTSTEPDTPSGIPIGT